MSPDKSAYVTILMWWELIPISSSKFVCFWEVTGSWLPKHLRESGLLQQSAGVKQHQEDNPVACWRLGFLYFFCNYWNDPSPKSNLEHTQESSSSMRALHHAQNTTIFPHQEPSFYSAGINAPLSLFRRVNTGVSQALNAPN